MPGAHAWGLKTFQPLHVPLPSPWERLLDVPHHFLCLKTISVVHRLGAVEEVGSVCGFLKCPKPPANLPPWGNAVLAMFFDVCSRVRLVNTCPGPHEMLLLQFRARREGGTDEGAHWVGSVWAGDVSRAEQSHSCQAHSSLPVDREQPRTACGWQRWVNRPVQAGAGQPELSPWSVRAAGSAGSAGSCRLVEACCGAEQRGGSAQLAAAGAGSAAKRMHPVILPSTFRGEAGSGCGRAWSLSLWSLVWDSFLARKCCCSMFSQESKGPGNLARVAEHLMRNTCARVGCGVKQRQ